MIFSKQNVTFSGEPKPLRISRATLPLIILAMPFALHALSPDIAVRQYLHTSWTQEQGFPLPPVATLVQSTDGYLWLGTDKGLMRFDGIRFTDWPTISGQKPFAAHVYKLHTLGDNGLLAFTVPGIWRVDAKRAVPDHGLEKLPCDAILSAVSDGEGGFWMVSLCQSSGVVARWMRDGSIQTYGVDEGIKPGVRSIFRDRQGVLWLASTEGLCRWTPGEMEVCLKTQPLDQAAIRDDCEGRLLVVDATLRQAFRLMGDHLEPLAPPVPDAAFNAPNVLRDRDGNVWIGTNGAGLLRIVHGRIERFTAKEQLSSNLVHSLLEDHEGNIWVATARGIDRFREPNLVRLSSEDGLSGDVVHTVFSGKSGVWLGMSGSGIDFADGKHITRFSSSPRRPGASVLSLYEDRAGRLWAGTSAGFTLRDGDRISEILTAGGEHLDRVWNVSGDRDGNIWLGDQYRGLFRVDRASNRAMKVDTANSEDVLYRLVVTPSGEAWLGYYKGGLTVLDHGIEKHYSESDGIAKGVRALYVDDSGAIWVGTARGLSRYQSGKWSTWTKSDGLPEGSIDAISTDIRNGLWLCSGGELLRMDLASLSQSAPTGHLTFARTEGLRMINGSASPSPTITRDRQGRIWVASMDGAAIIDPAKLVRNTVPPPVVIERVTADGKALDTASGVVHFQGRNLQIAYTGLSLTAAERVRFRYRMAELGRNWTDAEAHRDVTYVDLKPGNYSFQVTAANNDEVWNEKGATLAIVVDPYFYQTTWFGALCLAVIAAIAWGVHQFRVRQVVTRVQLIAAERTRFSRELHDSLLQGFTGVIYQLEAAVKLFDLAPAKSKKGLEKALDQADKSLREARQLITSMRIPALDSATLSEALRSTTAELTAGTTVDFHFEAKGRAKPLHYDVEANLFLIAREALTNSLKHSGATRIHMELNYAGGVKLAIEDNGAGFDADAARTKEGHHGFRGMEERARAISAQFTVTSSPGKGARIEVSL